MTTDGAGYSVFNSYTILRQYHWRDNIMSHAILTGRRRRSSCRGSGRHGRKPCKYREINSQAWRQTALAIAYLIVIVYCANIIVETTLCHMLYLPGDDDTPAAAGVADMVANPVSIWEIDSQVWRQTTLAIAYLIVILYCANITEETTLCRMLYLPGEDDAPAAAGVADMVANPVSIKRLIVRYDGRRRWQ